MDQFHFGRMLKLRIGIEYLKAWVALQKDTVGITDAILLKKSCSARLFAPIVSVTRLAEAGIEIDDSVDTSGKVCVNGDRFVIQNRKPHENGS